MYPNADEIVHIFFEMGAEASLCIEAMYMAVISAYIDMPN
jgi:hypothetical protein